LTDSRSEKIRRLLDEHPVTEAEAVAIKPLLPPPRALLASQHDCPYCTSQFTVTRHDGLLDARHGGPFGPGCDAGLRRLLAEEADDDGLRLTLTHT